MRFPSIQRSALLVAALLLAQPASATAYIRFANASLQGQPTTDKVQIKLDGVTLVDALGYKGASGYFDVDSGAPFLTVWFQGNKIVDRQLDLRDDKSYLFVIIGNGTTATYTVHAEYEPELRLDESMDFFNEISAATYPGFPRASERTGLGVSNRCSRRPNHYGGTSGSFTYTDGIFDPQFESDKIFDPTFYVPGVPLPVGTCRVTLTSASAGRMPPDMNPTHADYSLAPGTFTNQILVGDGVHARTEWWILQHRARFVEPRPIAPGSWASGIWVAPAVPGLSVVLDVDSAASTQKVAGMLLGLDRLGNARWYRLNQSSVNPEAAYMRLYPSEYHTNAISGVNEAGNSTELQLKFQSCNRARLSLGSIYGLRMLDIDAFGQNYRPVELERITPLAENCPR